MKTLHTAIVESVISKSKLGSKNPNCILHHNQLYSFIFEEKSGPPLSMWKMKEIILVRITQLEYGVSLLFTIFLSLIKDSMVSVWNMKERILVRITQSEYGVSLMFTIFIFIDQRLNGKIPKMSGHRLFPQARYTIWVNSMSQFQRDPITHCNWNTFFSYKLCIFILEHGAECCFYDKENAIIKNHKTTLEKVDLSWSAINFRGVS